MSDSACLFSETSSVRVVWGVYGKCSLNCRHCSVSKEDYSNPGIDKYGPVIKDMKTSGVDTIYMSGGEPLLWKHSLDFVKFVKENRIAAAMGTNGTELNKGVVEKLSDLGIDKIFLSLDSHKEDVHNYLRGENVFRKAVKGMELLDEHGVYTRVDSVLWRENYNNLDDFVEFCKDKGAEEMAFAWPVRLGNAIRNPDILIPEEKYFEVGQNLKSLKEKHSNEIKISYHRFEKFDSDCKGCSGGRRIFYLDWKGRLSPCFWISNIDSEFFTKENVFDKDFSRLKEDETIEKFIKTEEKRKEGFGPGCPAICKIYNNDIYSKDPLLV